MKKVIKKKLSLQKQTIRALAEPNLENVRGGISLFLCGSEICPTASCWNCMTHSLFPGC